MRALTYRVWPLGWAACKVLRGVWRGCLTSWWNGLSLREMPPPALPGEDWVRVRTLLGGICGTDLGIIRQRQRPDSVLQAYSSFPAVLGHENVAVVEEVGREVEASWKGRRVCVEPTLCCQVRGIDPPCPRCRAGEFGACENFAADGEGASKLPPGTSIGYNRVTGGSFGEFFLAHRSQLVPVPEGLSDEEAVLTDPLACSLHAVLRADLREAARVLVYGAGVLGLGVVASLRAVGYGGLIDAMCRHDVQAKLAVSLGADEALRPGRSRRERFDAVALRTGGRVHRVRFGNLALSGGYDVVFDCVGAAGTITESLQFVRSRGQVVLVGTGRGGRADLTPVWFHEATLLGSYGRQVEEVNGRRVGTYALVLERMGEGKRSVRGLLTHTFPLEDYREAFRVAMDKGRHGAVRVAFDFRGRR